MNDMTKATICNFVAIQALNKPVSLRVLAAKAFEAGYFPDTMTLGAVKDRIRHAVTAAPADSFQKLTIDGETHFQSVPSFQFVL